MSIDLNAEFGLVPEAQYAKFRGVDIPSLRNERAKGRGPKFVKQGKSVFYPLAAIRDHIKRNTVDPKAGRTLIDGAGPTRRRATPSPIDWRDPPPVSPFTGVESPQ